MFCFIINTRGGSRVRVQGVRNPPPPPREMTCGFLIQLVFCKKKNYVAMWFIGVEVEHETSAPPSKKNPGSAPEYVIIIPREARFIISSRAKRACITQASQGQRDVFLAINLSSLVGVRLDVIQFVTYERIMGFQATDCHRRQSFGFYS